VSALRVAQVGTSDLDNLGDLLFPLALRALLDDLARQRGAAIECVHFGPRGCAAGALYRDQLASLPLADFEAQDARRPFDLIFIGGGDLIRDDDTALDDVYPADAAFLPYSYLLSPSASPARRLVLLMPGAPFELGAGLAGFLRNSFTRVCAGAVRDPITRVRLAPLLGAQLALPVLPDSAAALAHYHPREALLRDCAGALPTGFAPGGYVLFQGNPGYCPDATRVAGVLRALQERTGLPILLFETGACMHDGRLLDVLAAEHGFAHAGRQQTLAHKLALIAGARALAGASLHGNILAHAYGVPHFCYAGAALDKLRGYFAGGGSGLLFDTFEAFAARLEEVGERVLAPPAAAPQAEWRAIRDFVAQALDRAPQPGTADAGPTGFDTALQAQYRACQQQLHQATRAHRTRERQLVDAAAALRQELAQALRQADQTLADLHASTSWRITAPLRALRGWFRS